jgi:hypothetical protein
MIAGIINICGAFGGIMSGPTRNNQKGMFENAAIRNTILKPYLGKLGYDRLGQYPLPDIHKLPIPNNWQELIELIMLEQGYKEGPWMYKGAKACLTWPIWHGAFPNAKWVIVRRRTNDIIASCLKTNFMRAFSSKNFQKCIGVDNEIDGWKWWVEQHKKRFDEMIGAGLNCIIVWPERMVTGDYSQAKGMIECLGLTWKEKEVKAFIDPKLWKAKKQLKRG